MRLLFLLFPCISIATEIQPINHLGERQYHKNYFEVKDNKIVEVTPTGKVEYHKQQYIILSNKIIPITATGQVQYHKGASRTIK
jgi:hypothetical protein